MNNESWGQKLRNDYERKTGSHRNIRLPSQDQIKFDGEIDCVTVTMKPKAIVANLQTNAAAFEAWSLALRVWCEVKKIQLRWESPSVSTANERCHYQRFLYRAARFRSLFQEWFDLPPEPREEADALGNGVFCLNVPGDRSAIEAPINGDEMPESTRKAEADLENYLWNPKTSKAFKEKFGLEQVGRQFPVGLFRNSVARDNRIFTGAKSAIDLVGIGKGALWLFELKAGANIPAGILSELIFYASVMRDSIPGPAGQAARFQFDPRKPENGMAVSATNVRGCDLKGCKRIEAVLLGEKFHPLVGDSRIIRTLNEAADLHWNTSLEQVPVAFSATLMKGSVGAGYQFIDGPTMATQ
jgi:hypothetical protein